MKKILLIFTISFLFFNNIFASMSVDEYRYAVELDGTCVNVEEVYISADCQNPIPVYEKPDSSSKILMYLNGSTPIKAVYTSGPKIDHYSEWHWNSSFLALILPMDYREKGHYIGWVDSGYCWWSPVENFDASNISMRSVNSYLDNSLWKFTKKTSNGEYTGILCFKNREVKGIFISTFDKNNKKSQKEFVNKYNFAEETIINFDTPIKACDGNTIFDNKEQKLTIYMSSFYMEDSIGSAYVECVNPLSFSTSKEERQKYYHNFVYSYLCSRCKYGYRLWQRDNMHGKNVFELMESYPEINKPELITFSIANGVLPLNTKYAHLYNEYWNPIIVDIEKKLDKNYYVQFSLPDIAPILRKNKLYLTKDNLRLRKSSDLGSDVILTLNSSDYVHIIQIGEPVVIDGIISNWVEIKVLSDAKDINGNPVKEGTTGWCFAGYLRLVEG